MIYLSYNFSHIIVNYKIIEMKIDDIHNKLVSHYHKTRNNKTKKSIQIESVVGKTYKKKV